MNKSEALAVLSEIRDALKKSEVLSYVSLDGSHRYLMFQLVAMR